jgi:protein FAM50
MASDSPATSGASTPRFTSHQASAEDLLKSQTVGLVNLEDFRKRRADAQDQKDRAAHDFRSSASTPGPEEERG